MDGVALGSGAFVPAQRLVAERAAQAAQRRADTLSAESQQARGEARRLSAQADRLERESVQSRREAEGARSQVGQAAPVTQVGGAPSAANPLPVDEARNAPALPPLPYRADRLYRSLSDPRSTEVLASRLDLLA